MKAYDLIKDEKFREHLEMCMKGYIDKMYTNAGMQPPVPKSLIPLEYNEEKVQKGLNQLMQGAKNALFVYDQFVGGWK